MGGPGSRTRSETRKSLAMVVALYCTAILSNDLLADASPDGKPAGTATSDASLLLPAQLSGSIAIIGQVSINNDNIFNLDDPEEDTALFRLANAIHVTTRQDVIAQQLLFTPGEQYSPRVIAESERILRSNRYLQDASIDAIPQSDGTVDLSVNTSDVWTLMPTFSLSRSGGANNVSLGLEEMNLFGTGSQIEAAIKSDVDRDSKIIKFVDRHLGDSWYSLNVLAADNSDGHELQFGLAKPFYSLDSTRAHGVALLDNDRTDSFYDRGEIVDQYQHESEFFEVFRGWSRGLVDGLTKRITTGLAYEEHRFTEIDSDEYASTELPEDRLFAYPFIGFELVEDEFEKASNHDQINRTEDRFLGTKVSARLGLASTAFGSDRDAWLVSLGAQTGFGTSTESSLILSSGIATRMEDDGLQDFLLKVAARYYKRQSDKRLFFASLSGNYGHNLDLDNLLVLGGDNGLRGYPLRYQVGDKSALLTLEQRYFSDWNPFRLFRVGGAVFFDAGRTWGNTPASTGNDGLLRNVGFGLRIANTRSGQGRMTHIDLAFPLDGDSSIDNVQFLVSTRKSF